MGKCKILSHKDSGPCREGTRTSVLKKQREKDIHEMIMVSLWEDIHANRWCIVELLEDVHDVESGPFVVGNRNK